jgi:hypothetical protein
LEKIKNENIKEIMGLKGKPDIIEKKRLQWYGHVKRMPEERITKLILELYQRRGGKEDVLEKHGWKEYTQP